MLWDAVHDSREAFLACLWAQCSPGTAHGPLPSSGLSTDPWLDGAAAVLLALLDPGLDLAVAGDDPEAQAVGDALRRRTGAGEAPVEDAAFVLVGVGAPAGTAAVARRGDPLVPELGATLVYGRPGRPQRVELRGPGIDGSTVADLPFDDAELVALAGANRVPPCGVDAFVVVPDAVLALPRTTNIRGVV